MKNIIFLSILGILTPSAFIFAQKPDPKVTYASKGPFGISDAAQFDKLLKVVEGIGTSA